MLDFFFDSGKNIEFKYIGTSGLKSQELQPKTLLRQINVKTIETLFLHRLQDIAHLVWHFLGSPLKRGGSADSSLGRQGQMKIVKKNRQTFYDIFFLIYKILICSYSKFEIFQNTL